MVKTDEDHVLYIEPKEPPTDPVWDESCELMAREMAEARPEPYRCRGFHTCTGRGCAASSTNTDYVLRSGQRTNALALHYLTVHRGEVPAGELAKVRTLNARPRRTNG